MEIRNAVDGCEKRNGWVRHMIGRFVFVERLTTTALTKRFSTPKDETVVSRRFNE